MQTTRHQSIEIKIERSRLHLLSRGLKSIPNPKDKNAKLELLKDF